MRTLVTSVVNKVYPAVVSHYTNAPGHDKALIVFFC